MFTLEFSPKGKPLNSISIFKDGRYYDNIIVDMSIISYFSFIKTVISNELPETKGLNWFITI